MLAPLAPLTAYRLDRARPVEAPIASPPAEQSIPDSTSGIELPQAAPAVSPSEESNWLRVSITLDRAARARGAERETMLRQFLEDEDMHPLPAAPLPYDFVSGAARNHADAMEEWAFLRLANTTLAASKSQQDAMLVDLAQGLLDAGQPHAALRGFACALSRHPHPRSALPAFGGTALAALGARGARSARSVVRFAASRVESLVASLGGGPSPLLPYESANALVELSVALGGVEEHAWSARCAAHAAQIAFLHRFHRLSYRLENTPEAPVARPTATPVQREIALRVEALEGAELVGV